MRERQCGLGLRNGVWKNFAIEAGPSKNIREIGRIFDGEPVPSLRADVEIVVMMNKSRMLSFFVDRYESQHFWPAAKLVEHTIRCKHK